MWLDILIISLGFAGLIWGADKFVAVASANALNFGVAQLMIKLPVTAMGTGAPELAATVAGALRGHHDLAIGNIVGSNIRNLLIVLLFTGLLSAGMLEPGLLFRNYTAMLLLTVALSGIFFWTIKSGKSIGRSAGTLFVVM